VDVGGGSAGLNVDSESGRKVALPFSLILVRPKYGAAARITGIKVPTVWRGGFVLHAYAYALVLF
jgi:hypothetical protein